MPDGDGLAAPPGITHVGAASKEEGDGRRRRAGSGRRHRSHDRGRCSGADPHRRRGPVRRARLRRDRHGPHRGVAGVPKGLLFCYFPKKIDILLTLLNERIPAFPLLEPAEVALPGDPAGSLLRIAQRLELGERNSVVLRIIIHREDSTHRVVRDRVLALREHLVDLTENVLDTSSPPAAGPRRRHAAQTFVAVMFGDANARRLDLPGYDLAGAAEVIVAGLLGASSTEVRTATTTPDATDGAPRDDSP
jgi:AcrR family transcriptional regulator